MFAYVCIVTWATLPEGNVYSRQKLLAMKQTLNPYLYPFFTLYQWQPSLKYLSNVELYFTQIVTFYIGGWSKIQYAEKHCDGPGMISYYLSITRFGVTKLT